LTTATLQRIRRLFWILGNPAGEIRPEPLNETSFRFRSGRMEKVPRFGRIIPLPRVKNQIEMNRRTWMISQILHFCDLSDEITGISAICEYGDVVREKHETL
jgi:hypothetical protein